MEKHQEREYDDEGESGIGNISDYQDSEKSIYSCDKCFRNFKYKKRFYIHLEEEHGEEVDFDAESFRDHRKFKKAKIYHCDHCDKRFSSAQPYHCLLYTSDAADE